MSSLQRKHRDNKKQNLLSRPLRPRTDSREGPSIHIEPLPPKKCVRFRQADRPHLKQQYKETITTTSPSTCAVKKNDPCVCLWACARPRAGKRTARSQARHLSKAHTSNHSSHFPIATAQSRDYCFCLRLRWFTELPEPKIPLSASLKVNLSRSPAASGHASSA